MTGSGLNDVPTNAAVVIPQLMSVTDVAAAFGRCERTIRRWIKRGLLVPVRINGSDFIVVDDVLAIISGRVTDRALGGR